MLSTHLSGPHTLADQLGEKGTAGAIFIRKTLIMHEKIIDFRDFKNILSTHLSGPHT